MLRATVIEPDDELWTLPQAGRALGVTPLNWRPVLVSDQTHWPHCTATPVR